MEEDTFSVRQRKIDGSLIVFTTYDRVTVDEITSINEDGWNNPIISIKKQHVSIPHDKDGYVDSSSVYWDSPYMNLPYLDGKISEEAWLQLGIIIGEDDPDFIHITEMLRGSGSPS